MARNIMINQAAWHVRALAFIGKPMDNLYKSPPSEESEIQRIAAEIRLVRLELKEIVKNLSK